MKKNIKQNLIFILVFAMLVSIAPIHAKSEITSGTYGDNITWEFDDSSGELIISGTGNMDGSSEDPPWSSYTKKVTINEGVTNICDNAFRNFPNLISVVIPTSINAIGYMAFYGCESLTSVEIPDGVTQIRMATFYGCTSLTSVSIPETVKTIETQAFGNCTSLEEITIPNSVTSVESNTFKDCDSLEKVVVLNPDLSFGDGSIQSGTIYGYESSTAETYAANNGLDFVVLCSNGTENHNIVTEVKDATCTVDGYSKEVCDICGYVKSDTVIDATGHTPTTLARVEPTCTETGLTEGEKCSVCKEILTAQTEIAALGHTEKIIDGTPATCTTSGITDGKVCDTCSVILVEQEVIPAKGHNVEVDVAVSPTCTETGLTEGNHCSVCNEILKAQDVVDETGHIEEVVPAVEATCEGTGLTEGLKCANCDLVFTSQETIPAIGHSYTQTVVKPTCENNGYTIYKCERCEDEYQADFTKALGHKFSDDEDYCLNGCGLKKETEFEDYDTEYSGYRIVPCFGQIKIAWNKDEKIDGYEVYIKSNKTEKYNLISDVKTKDDNYVIVNNLISKQLYNVKIKAYRMNDDKKVYSKESISKTVFVK